MPTYMLEGTTAVVLSARPLTVTLQVQGGASGTLVARVESGEDPGAVRPRPDLLVLPRVAERVVLRIEPAGNGTFPQGARAHVSIAVNDPDAPDPERAVLPPIDLAGLTGRDVLSVEPVAEGLRVCSEIEPIVRLHLDPLAETARVAATERLGTQRLPRDRAHETTIVIDPSASFRPIVRQGLLERVLNILEGLAAVIDPRHRPTIVIATQPPVPVGMPGEGGGAVAVVEALHSFVPSTGFSLPPVPSAVSGRPIRYLVTDALPPSLHSRQADGPGVITHLVLVGHESAWRFSPSPGVPTTLVDIEAMGAVQPDQPDPLTQRPQVVHALVASLLAGIGGEGRHA